MTSKRPELVVKPDPDAVAEAAADHLEQSAVRAIADRGRFRLALAGGSSPRLLYRLLATAPRAARIPWNDWQIYFGDERAVPPDDAASNYRMAQEALLGQVPIPEHNVHRMRGELEPSEAAARYEAELGAEPLDLVLLGMGDDGHTASLFPGTDALCEAERRVAVGEAPVAPRERITLTYRALSEADQALLLITGESKALRVRQVLAEIDSGVPELPAARVSPRSGLWFYLDRAAARALAASC